MIVARDVVCLGRTLYQGAVKCVYPLRSKGIHTYIGTKEVKHPQWVTFLDQASPLITFLPWGCFQIQMPAAIPAPSSWEQLLYCDGMISDQGVSRVLGEWRWVLSRPNQCLGTETEDKDQMHEPQCRDRNLSFDLMLKQIPWLMSRRGWISWDLLIWGPHRSGQLHRCGGSTMVWQCPCNFSRQCTYGSPWFGCLVSSSTPFLATHNDRNEPRSFRWWHSDC